MLDSARVASRLKMGSHRDHPSLAGDVTPTEVGYVPAMLYEWLSVVGAYGVVVIVAWAFRHPESQSHTER